MSEHGRRAAEDMPRASSGESRGAFFERGDRGLHLDELRHISEWSRQVVLVTGPLGVGKSTLCRQLSATLDPGVEAARITGSLVSDLHEVMGALLQGFGLAIPPGGDRAAEPARIADHARERERHDRVCVALVDDAELLDPKSVEGLLALAGESALRLVLFGEMRLLPTVERFADPRHLEWHEIRLAGFGPEEVKAYLEWRFAQSGYSHRMPFSQAQVKDIARISEGLPGRVDQMANVLLARINSAGAEDRESRFPARHTAALGALVVLVAFVYLLWQPDDVVEDSGAEPVDSPLTTDRGAPSAGDPPPAAGRPATIDESPSATPTTGWQEGEPDAPGDRGEAPPAEVPLPAPSISAPPAQQLPDADVEQPALAAEEPAPQQSPAVSDPTAPEPTPAPADEPKRAPASREPPVAQDKATARPEVPVVDIGTPVARYRDAEWIMRQPPAAYTLQLASFSTAGRADEYLEEQAIPESFARFRQQRDGRILHVVVYGSFDSEAAAEEAADNLPPGAGNVKPWIRTFERVQEAVRTALQP